MNTMSNKYVAVYILMRGEAAMRGLHLNSRIKWLLLRASKGDVTAVEDKASRVLL